MFNKIVYRFGQIRKAKTYVPSHYTAIPEYIVPEFRDIHETYKLKSRQEVIEYQEQNPPSFNVEMAYTHYIDHEQAGFDRNMNRKARIKVDIDEMKLTYLQKKRLEVVVGLRLQKNVLIMVQDMYPTYEENLIKVMEQLRECYWEALRAP